MTSLTLKHWYQTLIVVLIFLVPSNLFLKFFEQTSYVHGLQIDYLIPKLYASDLVILACLVTWLFELGKQKKINWRSALNWLRPNLRRYFWLLAMILMLASSQVLAAKPIAAGWYAFKLIELLLLGIFLWQKRRLGSPRLITISGAFLVLFQSLLAVYQFNRQQQLWGYLMLGEPNLVNQIGLAKTTWGGVEKILPYGTTAHPNILGGVLAISLLVLGYQLNQRRLTWSKLMLASLISLGLIALFLTQSWSAWVTLLLGVIALCYRKIIFRPWSIAVCFWLVPFWLVLLNQLLPEQLSILRRVWLSQAAGTMFISQPLTGVGLNNFTARVEEFSPLPEVVRFAQPVHPLGLLWLAETGLLGLVIVIWILKLLVTRRPALVPALTILWPLASLDHYLLTQQTGLLLASLGLLYLPQILREKAKQKADRA